MIATWQLELALQIAMAATPVAVYFLILGLLNSQRRPQILSARFDFSLLMAALSPLCVVPLLGLVGTGLGTISIAVAAVVAAIAVLTPGRHRGWVVYNIEKDRALSAIADALHGTGLQFTRHEERLELDSGGVIRITSFPLLRNVSISLDGVNGADRAVLRRFEAELARNLGRIEVVAYPMAVTLVLISTAVIVAPLALMADRMPEMVRLLTDLIG